MPSKAPGRPQERRSGSGLGMGTSPGLQRLVGPVSQTQTNVWELDRGGALRVLKQGGRGQRVHGQARQGRRQAGRARVAGPQRAGAKAPLSPRPYPCASGDLTKIFPTFSTTIFFKENVNVH